MKLKFLGTGTSQGIPVIGSTHPVCLSTNPKDKRLRSSVMITDDEGKKILIDCGPDFRQQMLTNQESNVDALLITHEHNDHIIGLDDLRPIIFQKRTAPLTYYTSMRLFFLLFGGNPIFVIEAEDLLDLVTSQVCHLPE